MKLPSFDANKIKNSSIMQMYRSFIGSNIIVNFIIKGVSLIIVWTCALIPMWLYLLARWLLAPTDFWQEFAIFCVTGIVVGWVQVITLVVGFLFSIVIILEEV